MNRQTANGETAHGHTVNGRTIKRHVANKQTGTDKRTDVQPVNRQRQTDRQTDRQTEPRCSVVACEWPILMGIVKAEYFPSILRWRLPPRLHLSALTTAWCHRNRIVRSNLQSTDNQTNRQTDKQTDRQIDRQTGRQAGRQLKDKPSTDRQSTYRHLTAKQLTHQQTDKQTDRQTNRQIEGQTDRRRDS